MLDFKESELKQRFSAIGYKINELVAIGNHHLKRHLVYKVKINNSYYVLKLYYKKNRWCSEIGALKILKDSEVTVPSIVDYGFFGDGLEWVIIEYVEGCLLINIEENLSIENKIEIYFEMGRQLALIHSEGEFNNFGRISEDMKIKKPYNTFKELVLYDLDRYIEGIDKFVHEEYELMQLGISKLLELIDITETVSKPSLCNNDFGPRNIIVVKENNKYEIAAIIDLEQSSASDSDMELIQLYYNFLGKNELTSKSFLDGYCEVLNIDMSNFMIKRRFYELYKGLSIVSWSKEVDIDHYNEGIELIRKVVI